MANNELVDELLNGNLKGAKVDAARAFLESCSSSTEALRALMAVMCEIDQLKEAAIVEAALPAIAEAEAESM